MYNEEKGINLEYRPSIHGHSKSHIHSTGKVVWINNYAGQKISPYTRKELTLVKESAIEKATLPSDWTGSRLSRRKHRQGCSQKYSAEKFDFQASLIT